MQKFRSDEDEHRYIEGRLTADESRRAIAWDEKCSELQSAKDAGVIEDFRMEPIDFGSDDLKFWARCVPQIDRVEGAIPAITIEMRGGGASGGKLRSRDSTR